MELLQNIQIMHPPLDSPPQHGPCHSPVPTPQTHSTHTHSTPTPHPLQTRPDWRRPVPLRPSSPGGPCGRGPATMAELLCWTDYWVYRECCSVQAYGPQGPAERPRGRATASATRRCRFLHRESRFLGFWGRVRESSCRCICSFLIFFAEDFAGCWEKR